MIMVKCIAQNCDPENRAYVILIIRHNSLPSRQSVVCATQMSGTCDTLAARERIMPIKCFIPSHSRPRKIEAPHDIIAHIAMVMVSDDEYLQNESDLL